MTAAISVVMPTYNGAAFVAEALTSIVQQTRRPDEIVVVDDCSQDATRDIVAEFARSAPVPIRLLALPENSGGPARPLNTGIAASSGKLIAVLDQDDVFTLTKLEEQCAFLTAHPSLAFVFSPCGRYGQPGECVAARVDLQALRAACNSCQGGNQVPGSALLRLLLMHGNFLIGYPALLFRRSAWEQKRGVDERLAIASDYEFICWLCLQGDAGFLDRIHYLRRFHDRNVCNQVEATRLEAYEVQARYVERKPWLLNDAKLSARLRDNFFDLAYFLRQRGRYREALRYHHLSLRTWGWRARTLTAMGKLLPHWAWNGRKAKVPA